jgi:hypothetical protein
MYGNHGLETWLTLALKLVCRIANSQETSTYPLTPHRTVTIATFLCHRLSGFGISTECQMYPVAAILALSIASFLPLDNWVHSKDWSFLEPF